MREKFGLWVVALTLMSFLAVLTPGQALAQALPPVPTPDPGCTQIDQDYANNSNSAVQGRIIMANAVAKQYPIASAFNACTQALGAALHTLTGLTSPFDGSVAGALITGMITSLVSSLLSTVCSGAVGLVSSVTSSITEFAQICLPIPSLGLGFGSFGLPACLGTGMSGTEIPLVASPSTGTQGSSTSISSYFNH